jgi:hypothetical protein
MLCLPDSIRNDDPSVQHLLRVMEDAYSLTALLLAVWQVARILAVRLVEAGPYGREAVMRPHLRRFFVCDHRVCSGKEVSQRALFCCRALRFVVETRLR